MNHYRVTHDFASLFGNEREMELQSPELSHGSDSGEHSNGAVDQNFKARFGYDIFWSKMFCLDRSAPLWRMN